MEEQSGDLERRLRSLIVNNSTQSESVSLDKKNDPSQQSQKPVRGRGRNRYRQKLELGPNNNFHSNQPRENNHPNPWQHDHGRGRGKPFHQASSQGPSQIAQPHRVDRGTAPRSRSSLFSPLVRPREVAPAEHTGRGLYLEQLAARELPAMEMSLEEFQEKDAFRARLEELCQKAVSVHLRPNPPSVRLLSFGSLSSGFGMPGSDMDLALVASYIASDLFRILEKAFLEVGLGGRLLTRTRVPILKVCQNPTPELYSALHNERRKWEDMTPEEREEYDHPHRREESGRDEGNEHAQNHVTKSRDAELYSSEKTEKQQTCDSLTDASAANNPNLRSDGEEASLSISEQSSKHPGKNGTSSPDEPNEQDRPSGSKATTSKTHLIQEKDSRSHQDLEMKPRTLRPLQPWFREKYLGPLDFPKAGVGIQCDINFANPLGLHNTLLLRCYSHCDLRVRLMVLFVKAWASRRKINSSYNGTLSSYGYVLMVLHYLVSIAQPYVCPNLQLCRRAGVELGAPPNKSDPDAWCEGCDIRFWRNENEIMELAAKNMLTRNQEPLGSLLRDFFHYYAHQGHGVPCGGFSWTRDVLSLRTPGGLLSKGNKGWTGAKTTLIEEREVRQRYLFAIEDPFELDHNVARTVTHNGICAIRDEFRRAWRMITDAGRGTRFRDDLFAEVISIKPRPEESPAQIDTTKTGTASRNAYGLASEGKARDPA